MDSTLLLVLPALLFAMWAQFRVKSTFLKYSQQANKKGLSGKEVAEMILEKAGIRDVTVEATPGSLTDHYDPRTKTVRLSEDVYSKKSLSALGVAAHEVGHAIQHDLAYAPLSFRTALFPSVSFGSRAAFPIFMLGMILSYLSAETFGVFGLYVIYFAIALFTLVVLFQLVTLPVEFNASRRAVEMLDECRILDESEIHCSRKVLNAAALTYVAAAASAIMQLVRMLIIANRRR